MKHKGPVEELKWTDSLKATVVTAGNFPRVHGYDVKHDMPGKFTFSGMIYLALTGDLPSPRQLELFETVLLFLAPVSVANAPVHASLLSGLCGADLTGITGVASVTLSQRSAAIVKMHEPLLKAADSQNLPEGDDFFTDSEEELKETAILSHAVEKAGFKVPGCFHSLTPSAAVIVILNRFCGIRQSRNIQAVFTLAGLPCTMAEGMAATPGNFRSYPILLPEFEYDDERS